MRSTTPVAKSGISSFERSRTELEVDGLTSSAAHPQLPSLAAMITSVTQPSIGSWSLPESVTKTS